MSALPLAERYVENTTPRADNTPSILILDEDMPIKLPDFLLPRSVTPTWIFPLLQDFIRHAEEGTLTYAVIHDIFQKKLKSKNLSATDKLEGALYMVQEINMSLMRGGMDHITHVLGTEISEWIRENGEDFSKEIKYETPDIYCQLMLQQLDGHFSRTKPMEEDRLVECARELWGMLNNYLLTPNNRLAILTSLSWLEVTNKGILEALRSSAEVFDYVNMMRNQLFEIAQLDPTNIPALKYGDHDLTKPNLTKKFAANTLNTITNLLILGERFSLLEATFADALASYGSGGLKLIKHDLLNDIKAYRPDLAESIEVQWKNIHSKIHFES